MGTFDRALFRAINGWPDALDPVLTPFSVAHDTLWFRATVLLIIVAMVWRGGKFRRTAILSLVAFPLADYLCNVIKSLVPQKRPYQEMVHVISRVGLSESAGTASSHAANLAAIATVMTLGLGWRWGAPWIVIALLVGVSRVYVGAHYPWQVLVGWTVGILMGLAVNGLVQGFRRRKDRPTSTAIPESNLSGS